LEKQDYIKYWIKTSEDDLNSMESVFLAGRYDWALFIGHLALEKILKAIWVKNNESNIPTKTHNLLKISEEAHLSFNEEDKLFLNRVTNFQLETRYPDYRSDFYKLCTKEFAEENIKSIKGLYKCIKEKI
jgi:HEPN domain-containing protein